MRARNIKPGFFLNEQLAGCSPWARLLFAGLWCVADRDGRLEDRPLKIKAAVFPYDAVDVDAELGALESCGLILRYEADGVRCILIPNFSKHQRPHKNEVQSELPDPLSTKVESTSHQGTKPCAPRSKALRSDSLLSDPGLSDPCSLNPDAPSLASLATAFVPPAKRAARATLSDDQWRSCWQAYPAKRRGGSQEAARAVQKAAARLVADKRHPNVSDAAEWLHGRIRAYAESALIAQSDPKYVPLFATWVNGGRYDEPDEAWVGEVKPKTGIDLYLERLDREEEEARRDAV